MRVFIALAMALLVGSGCLASLESPLPPQGFTREPTRVQQGSGAALLIDFLPEAEPWVSGDAFKLRAKAGSLNPDAQTPNPDCVDCWVYDVAALRSYTVQNLSLSVQLPVGLDGQEGDPSWRCLRIEEGETHWRGSLESGEMAQFELTLRPDCKGSWKVDVFLEAKWSDIGGEANPNPSKPKDRYVESDSAFFLYDGTQLWVRSDPYWCGTDGSRSLDPETFQCLRISHRGQAQQVDPTESSNPPSGNPTCPEGECVTPSAQSP